MKDDSNPKDISRRRFIQGLGTGVVGSAVLPSVLKGEPAKKEKSTDPHPGNIPISLTVNGKKVTALVETRTTLLELIRDRLNLTGTKLVCNQGECGGCTVLVDNIAIYACHFLAVEAAGKEIITIEGLMKGEELHSLQQAFIDHDGLQCGFCTPGQIMAAKALLLKYPKPTTQQVREGMAGNLCKCGAYPNIIKSVKGAAEKQG